MIQTLNRQIHKSHAHIHTVTKKGGGGVIFVPNYLSIHLYAYRNRSKIDDDENIDVFELLLRAFVVDVVDVLLLVVVITALVDGGVEGGVDEFK